MADPGPGTSNDGAKSTADDPWPVRVVSQKVGSWISKLG